MPSSESEDRERSIGGGKGRRSDIVISESSKVSCQKQCSRIMKAESETPVIMAENINIV